MMNHFLKSKFLLIGLLSLSVFACTTKESAVTTIELLTGYSKIEIGKSTVQYDGKTHDIITYDTEEIEGINHIVLSPNKTDEIAISITGQEIDGKKVAADINSNTYRGTDFVLTKVKENITKATGVLKPTDTSLPNKDIVIVFDRSGFGEGASTITVNKHIATINGVLGSITFNQILDLNKNNPEVNTLLLKEIGGSVNDEVNVQTGRIIRKAGYITWVNNSSEVFSGGVDLFCGGKTRVIETGATLGVHSWCCGSKGEDAGDIPEGDSQHKSQIDYFTEMLGDPLGKEFYFFTIKAAKASGIHNMTATEMEKYGLATK